MSGTVIGMDGCGRIPGGWDVPSGSIDSNLYRLTRLHARISEKVRMGIPDLRRFLWDRKPPQHISDLTPAAALTLTYMMDLGPDDLSEQDNEMIDWFLRDLDLGVEATQLIVPQLRWLFDDDRLAAQVKAERRTRALELLMNVA